MNGRYTKPSKKITTTHTNNTTAARSFLEKHVMNYCIPSKVYTENSFQFVPKLFVAACSTLELNNVINREC